MGSMELIIGSLVGGSGGHVDEASIEAPIRLTAEQMLEAVSSCDKLAWKLAYTFHTTNPICDVEELYEVAVSAMKHAALRFDPSRGLKFITPAYQYARFALID